MSFHLRHVLPPVVAVVDGAPAAPTATPSRTLVAGVHLAGAEETRLLGNDDLAGDPRAILRSLGDERDHRKVVLVAVAGPDPHGGEGLPTASSVLVGTSAGAEEAPRADLDDITDEGEILGWGYLQMPVHEETDHAYVSVEVRRGQRRRGIGQVLLDALTRIATADGRPILECFTAHHPPQDDDGGRSAPVLRPASGSGAVPRDASSEFLTRRGWTLAQVEAHSVLEVAEGLDRADALQAEADAGRGDEYEILTWVGRTPPELREDLAALYQRMSVDIPHGDLDWEEEAWDVGRLDRMEQRRVDVGHVLLTAAARHRGTGTLVAFTVLKGSPGIPAVTQEETLVHGEHRGHRLGLAVKLANLRLLAAEAPERVRIHTWNADENAHMLAINHAMGFRPRLVEGVWQTRVS